MSEVFRGVRADDEYDKEVAVKVLLPGYDTASLVERFKAEKQILATLDQDGIPKKAYDTVVCSNVLEHIEDDAGALEAWARRLRPGGWLLLSVPAHQSRYSAADELVGHYRRYDPEPMAALLRQAGFAEVELREYGMPLGYLLEAGRNAVGRKRLAAAPSASMEQRTGTSGRLLQPRSALQGTVTRWGTAPFRYVQRGFPRTGTGLVVRAQLPAAQSAAATPPATER